MKCYVCGNRLGKEEFCKSCGTDVRLYRHIMCMSNKLYNEGLEKANVRDLSGAIISLNESLKYNKMNIDARNLLGLCYYERGEVVLALSEWVISKNYESKKNIADEYINSLQDSPAKLDTLNQTIKKFNQALNYCYQNSQDLAIIQLKKVLSINENLISAYQLLGLLYIENGEYDKAKRTLLRALRIDTNDTTTQRYLKEINNIILAQQNDKTSGGNTKDMIMPQEIITYQNGNETIIQPVTPKEKRGFSSIINIVIGLVIGIGICWYLILPGRITKATEENDEKFIQVSEALASEKASHQEDTKQLETKESEIAQLKHQIEELTGTNGATAENDRLLRAALSYVDNPDNAEVVMTELESIGPDFLSDSSDSFKELYDKLIAVASKDALSRYLDTAKNALKTKDYKTAIEYYQKAYELDETNSDNLMALAYAYRESGDKEKADEMYRKVITDFGETENAMDAAEYITGQE